MYLAEFENGLTIEKMLQAITQSKEYQNLSYENLLNIPISHKKTNDLTEFSNEYENQIKSSNPKALCFVDIFKMAYYNKLPLSERFTEYFWILKNLETKGNLLDIGCTESLFAQELSKINSLSVYGIDIRPIEYTPNFEFSQENAEKTHFDDNYFDQITVVSTLEHFGLNFYGNNQIDEATDFKALKEIKRILKNDGTIFLTLPFGNQNKSWYRKYDRSKIEKLFSDLKIKEIKIIKQTHIGWKEIHNHDVPILEEAIYYKELELPGTIAFIRASKS